MKKTLLAFILGATLSSFAFAELPPTNQYGGYDNVEKLTLEQLEEFKQTPRYKEIMSGIIAEMQKFDDESKRFLNDETLTTAPTIPELTVEQKSFLTKEEIQSWNFAREKTIELASIVDKSKQRAKEIEKQVEAAKDKVEKENAKSMADLPEQMSDNFTRDEKGNLIFTPKVDMSKLPEIKLPESNCDLLDGHTK